MVETPPQLPASPGEILRGARELYGWSIDAVAAELNLLPHVVEALEADDYSHTAGWTYAVGYLRSYARLTGVSIEAAIADRHESLPPKEDGPGTMTEGASRKRQPVAIHYRWVVTTVVLLLVVSGLYVAYLNRSTDVERGRVDLADKSRTEPVVDSSTQASENNNNAVVPRNPELAVILDSPEIKPGDPVSPAPVPATTQTQPELPPKESAGEPAAVPEAPGSKAPGTTPTSESREQVSISQPKVDREPETAPETPSAVPVKPEPKAKAKAKAKSQPKVKAKPEAGTPATAVTARREPERKKATLAADRLVNTAFSTDMAGANVTSGGTSTTATRPVSTDTRRLTVRVRESTHLVVWDRDEQTLFRRYVEAGKVISLAGDPPFTLLVSYPEGTSIIYRGRELSIPAPKTGRNAKVRVGRQ